MKNNIDLKQINLIKEIKDPFWNRLSQLVICNKYVIQKIAQSEILAVNIFAFLNGIY